MSNSGPHWNPDGRCYYVMNGQSVWVAAGGDTVSSAAGIANSVHSAYVSSRFPPNPTVSQSWPPSTASSDMRERLTAGYPTTQFGGGKSQGSCPAQNAQAYDPYRQAMNTKTSGPPKDSVFSQSNNNYKDLDASAGAAEDQYKARLQTARTVNKKMRLNYPGVYGGMPLETREWHKETSKYASRAAQAFRVAKKAREEMARNFPGYDGRKGAVGHKQRMELLRSGKKKMKAKYAAHYNSHSI